MNLLQLGPKRFGGYLEQKSGHSSDGIKPGNHPHLTALRRVQGPTTIRHRKTGQEKLEKEIGKALEAARQVESVAWRLANKNAGARETAEEKRNRRMSPDFRQAIVLAEWYE
jgi:hypothetical protein